MNTDTDRQPGRGVAADVIFVVLALILIGHFTNPWIALSTLLGGFALGFYDLYRTKILDKLNYWKTKAASKSV